MIYHSMCGDRQKAEEAADRLLSIVRDEREPRTVSRALGNVGVAYRYAGRIDEAEAVFSELLQHSLAHGLLSRISFAMLGLIRIYLDRGEVPRARASMDKLDALTEDQDFHRSGERLYFLARLALEEKNIEEASEGYAELAVELDRAPGFNRRAAVLALGIRIALQQKAPFETIRPMIAELETTHLQNRSSGGQDVETYALALGLRYCGESERGLRLLSEYASTHRRERWPLPQPLNDLVCELQGSYSSSATRRIDGPSATSSHETR
jgi:tetratricopeptide (TPR) repeat protein